MRLAVSDGDRSPDALTSTLAAVIRTGAASPLSVTWPDGWLSTTAVLAGTLSR